MVFPVEKERLSEKAKQSKELSEEKSEKWSEEKKHLEERIMELETGQSNGDDLKQQMETLTNAFGNCNDLKIQIETLEKEKQDIVERCTNSEEQLKFNDGQWSMREKDYEDQIEELKNQLKYYEDEKKALLHQDLEKASLEVRKANKYILYIFSLPGSFISC